MSMTTDNYLEYLFEKCDSCGSRTTNWIKTEIGILCSFCAEDADNLNEATYQDALEAEATGN